MTEPSVRQNPEQHGQPESVVVGIDASTPAREALDWAAAEAARRSVPLRIVPLHLAHCPVAVVPHT